MEIIAENSGERKLWINGFGRIGKLAVWHQVAGKYFSEIVVNIGREVGTSLTDIAHYLERDSTYGLLQGFLYGHRAERAVEDIDHENGVVTVDGTPVRFLRNTRNPADIEWRVHGVELVLDTTGKFLDPTLPADDPKGSVRGHIETGAKKVLVSAPFKIKDKRKTMLEDAVTTIMGINENEYDPRRHKVISTASCTTTCLAHMIKPLIEYFGSKRILSASMATVHAVTGSQEVLDRMPKAGADDLRKNRSVINNIILITTGAAKALALVIPEMEQIGFIAESVRIPTTTGSLIILVINIQEEFEREPVNAGLINDIYRKAATGDPRGYLRYTDKQNVSCDIIGTPGAAAIIEGHETHTRTAEVNIDLAKVSGLGREIVASLNDPIRVPVTQIVIYGWYDNEMGSYVNMMCDRAVSVAENM
jgi:glyceraldehyde 3-phosphate dehydrogenase